MSTCLMRTSGRFIPDRFFDLSVVFRNFVCHVQIRMNEASMPKTVLCIATKRLAREMLRKDGSYEGEWCTYTSLMVRLAGRYQQGQRFSPFREQPLTAADKRPAILHA